MINWTETDNRMQTHQTAITRINQQAWRQEADGTSARLEPHAAATLRGALALWRAAGRRLALPVHRGTQSS